MQNGSNSKQGRGVRIAAQKVNITVILHAACVFLISEVKQYVTSGIYSDLSESLLFPPFLD